jgi:hypothetical protein
VKVDHHRDLAEVIETHQERGWRLHTYTCTGIHLPAGTVYHYVLFERGD